MSPAGRFVDEPQAPMADVLDIGSWHSLGVSRKTLDLETCLEGGQAFNWVQVAQNHWSAVAKSSVITVTYNANHEVIFNVWGLLNPKETFDYLWDYFRLDMSLEELMKKWRQCDAYFASICDHFSGVRILRQEPLLTLLSFICSSNNNISRITKMVQSLHVTFGTRLSGLSHPLLQHDTNSARFLAHDFPTLDQLSSKKSTLETELKTLGFGYRAKFISKTVELLSQMGGTGYLYKQKQASYADCISFLLQFPGVGRKVADCVALFGLDQLDAFPIDIHMYKLSQKIYRPLSSPARKSTLSASDYIKIREYFCNLFQTCPGWAQSILFTSQLRRFSAF